MGQNFLRNEEAVSRIVSFVSAELPALEIGPGQGAITGGLIEKGIPYTGVELDAELCKWLKSFYRGEKIRFICGDILKTDIPSLYPGEKMSVVGNIPYYITSPILFYLLKFGENIHDIVLMMQREVAKRLIAGPENKKAYGILSIMVGYRADIEYLMDVPAEDFYPVPKVDSAVVRIRLRPWPGEQPKKPEFFEKIVKKAFGQRRKMLRASLNSLPLELTKINGTLRPENLSIEEWIRLSNELAEIIEKDSGG
jgi:16S rRNA (adenine1518-N6/adenine1519-N6)-dimethyltransferase